MKTLVNMQQSLGIHVRIKFGRSDVRVPQHLLNRPQVRSAFQQVRRERMPQHVRRHALVDLRRRRALDRPLKRAVGHMVPPPHS